jgi:hypothetical protein
VWLPLQRQADHLGRQARVPLRWRPLAVAGRMLVALAKLFGFR